MVLNAFNRSVLLAVQSFSSAPLDYFFLLVTALGNPFFWVFAGALLFWKGEEKESFFLMNAVVFSAIVTGFLKVFFMALRPGPEFRHVEGFFDKHFSLPADRFSFPSGHATTISAVFAFFYNKIKKLHRIFFAAIVLLVMVSRMYLGKHFPIDVMGGLLFGLAAGAIAIRFNAWFDTLSRTNPETKRFAGLVLLGMVFLAVIFLFESFALASVPIGYYAGLFLFKELGFDSPKISGKTFLFKALFGSTGLGLIFLALALVPFEPAEQALLLFFAGIWTTLLFPVAFDKIRVFTR